MGEERDPTVANAARMGHPKAFFGINARPPAHGGTTSLTKCYSCGRMTAELSQPTLGLLRRILEGMEPAYAVALPDRKKFWKNQLFDFGFPPRVIEMAVSYEFRWGDIISDLFVGKFGLQNQHFADALPPYFCEQTLKRLLALALHEGIDS